MALPDAGMQAAIAANRFGLGAARGELQAARPDPRGWLAAQLSGDPPRVPDPDGTLAPAAHSLQGFLQTRAVRRAMQAGESRELDAEVARAGDPVRELIQFTRPIYLREVEARMRAALQTPAPLVERLVWFWSNHFTVSAQKPVVAPIAGAFEREAIRPHVLGRFEDLLLAAVRHPAMILYLDNQLSLGPGSRIGRRRGRGLNENLAREILELHTLGVDGGYDQADVTSFAAALTGWTLQGGRRNRRGAGEYRYVRAAHEPGDKTLLGRRYPDSGEKQAEAMLRDLARHPSTARHLATKLLRHFAGDPAPAPAVERLGRVFLDSDGDLRAVSRALIEFDATWVPERRKLKSPQEFVVSALRGLGVPAPRGEVIVGSLDTLGQRPFFAPSPAGWPDGDDAWSGSDGVYKRIEWAAALAGRAAGWVESPRALAQAALGPQASEPLLASLGRAESRAQAVTLLLASPEFQRR